MPYDLNYKEFQKKKKKRKTDALNILLLIILLFGISMYMNLKSKFIVCPFPVWPCFKLHDDSYIQL